MRYIDQWLSGLGLDHIIPLLQEHGITTPNKLAQLSLRDMYEVVGVNDAEDRKKLYFLIQRLQSILKKGPAPEDTESNESDSPQQLPLTRGDSDRHPVDGVARQNHVAISPLRARPSEQEKSNSPQRLSGHSLQSRTSEGDHQELSEDSEASSEQQEEEYEESTDLRVLRRQHQNQGSPQKINPHSQPLSISVPPNTRLQQQLQQQQPREFDPPSQRPGRLSVPPVSHPRGTNVTTTSHSIRAPSPINVDDDQQPNLQPQSNYRSGPVTRSRQNSQQQIQQQQLQQQQQYYQQPRSYYEEDLSDPAELEEEEYQPAPPPTKGRSLSMKPTTPQMTYRKPVQIQQPNPQSTPSRLSAPVSGIQRPAADGYHRGRAASPPPSPPPTPPPPDDYQEKRSGNSRGRHQQQQPQQQQQQYQQYQQPQQGYNSKAYDRPATSEPPPSATPRRSLIQIQSQKPQSSNTMTTRSQHAQSAPPQYDPQYQQQQYSQPQLQHSQPHQQYSQHQQQYSQPQQFEEEIVEENVQDMAIRVVVKKRPLNRLDGKGDKDVLEIRGGGHVLVHEPKTKVDLTKIVEINEFFFDDAFTDMETNELIYARAIRPLVNTALDGGKGSCFAYGQTGSGKTFTMMGSNPSAPATVRVNAGLYVLAARDIFRLLDSKTHSMPGEPPKNFQVMISCFEIYGGKLFDLLNDRGVVKCLEDSKQQVQLPGLTEHRVQNINELLSMMSKAHEQRSTGSTGANLESSRSHQVLQLSVQMSTLGKNKKPTAFKKYGQLSFIDLAGSERGADTTNNSKQTRMEGAEINTSLLALKEVIRSLEKKHGHTPFRGSKLTQVLKDSFVGEKTRTCMVACVSPNMSNCEHTLNTLRYADRVKEHQTQAQGGPPQISRAKSDSVDYEEPYTRPATAHQLMSRDELIDNSSRPNTAFPTGRETNRRASLDRSGSGIGPSGGSNNSFNPPPSLTRAKSIGASSSRRFQPQTNHQIQQPSSSLSNDHEYEEAPSRKYPGYQEHARQLALPSQSQSGQGQGQIQGKRLESSQRGGSISSIPPASASASVGIRLLRGGNNNVGISRDLDWQMNPSQSMSKPPPPPEEEEEEDFDNYEDNGEYQDETSDQFNEDDELDDEDLEEEGEEEEEEVGGDGQYDAAGIFDYDKNSSLSLSLGGTFMLQKTVDLVSAHKLAIAEMVEVMKEEMELVQSMEQATERDSFSYVEQMEQILSAKLESVNALRTELRSFQQYRQEYRTQH